MPRDRGAVTGRFGCAWMPCSWLSGAVTERTTGAVSVAPVLQDLLTVASRVVRTRAGPVRLPEPNKGKGSDQSRHSKCIQAS